MTYNDILRRVRYALNLSDAKLVKTFALGGQTVTVEQARAWMGKEDDEGVEMLPGPAFADFLDGLVIDRRGPRDPALPEPPRERILSNNAIFKKLRIALVLDEPTVLAMLEQGGQPLSKHELSALFRKPKHKHYRACGDQVLRAFLKGLTLTLRPQEAAAE